MTLRQSPYCLGRPGPPNPLQRVGMLLATLTFTHTRFSSGAARFTRPARSVRWVPHLRGSVGHDHPPPFSLDGQDDVGVPFHFVTVATDCSFRVRHGRRHLRLLRPS